MSATWLGRTALAAWSLVAIAVVVLYGHFAMDDFFITYRYAANLASGQGFVFNPGERVFGVTEPAQVVLLGLLRFTTRLPLPLLGSILTGAGLAALAWLVWSEARRADRPLVGLVAGTAIVFQTLVWACRGAGVVPALALLAAAAALRRRPILAGLLGGTAVWFRPEIVLGVGLLVLWILVERDGVPAERFRRAARLVVAAAFVGAVGALLCWLYFGRITPITLLAKQHFGAWDPVERGIGWHFWPRAEQLVRRSWGPFWEVLVGLGLLGGVRILWRGEPVERVLIAFGAMLALLYPILEVPFFGWYVIPCLVAILIGHARFVGDAWSWIRRRLAGVSPAARTTGLALSLSILLAPSVGFLRGMGMALLNPNPSPQFEAYRAAGDWIRAHSEPGDDVAALEVGTLAYFAERRVVDLLGLVTPEAIERVRDRTVIEGLRENPTEFFVLTQALEGLTGPVRSLPWFEAQYARVKTFDGERPQSVWVFRRRSTIQ